MTMFWISLMVAWVVYHWVLRPLLLDLTRQRLFNVRDRAFDYVLENEIDFNENAYGMLRGSLNGMISQCHRFTLLGFIVAKIGGTSELGSSGHKRFENKRTHFIKQLGQEHQEFFENQWELARRDLVLYFFLSSISLTFLIVAIGFCLSVVDFVKWVRPIPGGLLGKLNRYLEIVAQVRPVSYVLDLIQSFGFTYQEVRLKAKQV